MAATPSGPIGQSAPHPVTEEYAGVTEPALNLCPNTEEKTAHIWDLAWSLKHAIPWNAVRV